MASQEFPAGFFHPKPMRKPKFLLNHIPIVSKLNVIYSSEACAETDVFFTIYYGGSLFRKTHTYDKVDKMPLTNVSTEPSVSAQVSWEYLLEAFPHNHHINKTFEARR